MQVKVDKRMALLAGLAMFATAAHAGEAIDVLKTSGCGCCLAWIEGLEAEGYEVTANDVDMASLMSTKVDAGIPPHLASCHTGRIAGYVVEGHVPTREIERLLRERPDAVGLTVPGMPLGSPGMDFGDEAEPYDVLLVRRDGSTEVFASYP